MAEQYSWLDASGKGYSAGQYGGEAGKLMKWSRNTVADGKWLNKETIEPFSGRDQYLLVSLNQTYDECSAFSGYLNEEIRIINARADVIDVVGNHDAFIARSAALVSGVDVSDRDVIKILNDVGTNIPVWIYDTENNVYVESGVSPSNQQTYYRWLSAVNDGPSGWEYVGDLEPYYKNVELTENSITFENTAPERDYTIKTDLNRFIQMSADGNTGTIGITDDFINSASQVYNALSSISGINEGTIEGARVNHTVSNYSLAQGSACSASYDSFAQGRKNYANGQSIAAGVNNYAKNQSQALGSTNSATSDGFAAGTSAVAKTDAFAQGQAILADYISMAQGISTSATSTSFAQGKNTSAYYNAFAQGLNGISITASFAQGENPSAHYKSFAQGSDVSAYSISLAQGNSAIAKNYSIAQGYKTSANYYSFAQGNSVTAGKTMGCALAQGNDVYVEQNSFGQGSYINSTVNSFAQGVHCSANDGAFAQGVNNSAIGPSQTLGEGLRASNGMAIGKYNKTTDARFVIGNGIDDDNRSDLYWINNAGDVYTNGNVSAKNFYINGNPIDSIVSAKFSAYNGDTKIAEIPISAFKLQANTAKYISATSAANTMIFNVSDALINSASSGYQAKQWINTNGDGIIGVSSTVYNNSANWQATYSAVSSNSATWNETAYVPLSAIECKIGNANNVSDIAFAQGTNNTAEYTAFAQGSTNTASMDAFSQGISNTAAQEAFTQGSGNNAEINSFAQGKANNAAHTAFAQGLENTANGYSFAQGYKNDANSVNEPLGMSFAQGYANTADVISFAQGRDNHADNRSFAQGSANTAIEIGFAHGVGNHADGGFANGTGNTALGTGSLAIGINNYAGNYSQALGRGVKINGFTTAPLRGGMAIGTFNKTSANVAFVIGNGTNESNRSDLYWIDYDGNVSAKGNVSATNFYINGNSIDSIVSAKFSAYNGSNTLLTAYPISSFGLYANTAKYITVSTSNNNRLDFSVADALINSASSGYQAKQWINTNGDGIIGVSSTVYNNSAAWGETAYVPLSAIECKIGNANSANEISFAQGQGASAKTISFAQGLGSVAQRYSFAQGLTNSSTECSFTQGISNIANDYSIAQGVSSTALNYSQAFGAGSVITNTGMAIGNFNKTSAGVAFVIGNGHDNTRRSDLYWIDHDGNVSAKGNISATNFYINGTLLPDLTYTMLYSQGSTPQPTKFNISSLNVTNYRSNQSIDFISLNVTASNGSNASFALWPDDTTITGTPVKNTLIPIIDTMQNRNQKKYMKVSDLNIGNYVSAATIEGVQQKITIATAHEVDDFTQEGIIYLVF